MKKIIFHEIKKHEKINKEKIESKVFSFYIDSSIKEQYQKENEKKEWDFISKKILAFKGEVPKRKKRTKNSFSVRLKPAAEEKLKKIKESTDLTNSEIIELILSWK